MSGIAPSGDHPPVTTASQNASAGRPTQTLEVLPVGRLVPNPDNGRDLSNPPPAELAELLKLGESIRDEGLKQPLRVLPREEKYTILSGNRRYHAAKLVGVQRLACLVLSAQPTATEMLIDQLVENGQRRDFHDLEKLEIYQQLLTLNGWTPKQLADALKVSEGQVSRTLTLRRLCPEVQERVRAGRLKGTLAYQVARVGSSDTQKSLAQQVLDGMTREVLEVKVRELLKGSPKRLPKLPVIALPYSGLDATERALLAEVEAIRAARKKGYTDDDYATRLRHRTGARDVRPVQKT